MEPCECDKISNTYRVSSDIIVRHYVNSDEVQIISEEVGESISLADLDEVDWLAKALKTILQKS